MFLFAGTTICLMQFGNAAAESTFPFQVIDFSLGIGVVALSFVSFLWHSGNHPIVQYIDLTIMEAVIAFILVRYVCLILPRQTKSKYPNLGMSSTFSALVCTVLCLAALGHNVLLNLDRNEKQLFHSTMPTGEFEFHVFFLPFCFLPTAQMIDLALYQDGCKCFLHRVYRSRNVASFGRFQSFFSFPSLARCFDIGM